MSPVGRMIWLAIRAYQLFVSPLMAPSCRYVPSCSRYAMDAIDGHGAVRGTWLALRRLLRCHPWGGMGYDPVPEPRARPGSAPAAKLTPGS
jgi:putative membrane protein insertion efficiency factor